jgi:hypothetical protein
MRKILIYIYIYFGERRFPFFLIASTKEHGSNDETTILILDPPTTVGPQKRNKKIVMVKKGLEIS